MRTCLCGDRAIAAWLASTRRGVVAGVAASALHGAPWVDPDVPIELVGVKIRPQHGLVPRIERIADDEIAPIVRPACDDSGADGIRLRAAPRANGGARAAGCADVESAILESRRCVHLADRYPRARGLRQLRELLPLVDGGAESPRESRLGCGCIDAGFSRPETQIPVSGAGDSCPVAFLDMGWRDFMVAVEYDGDHHRKDRRQYVKDIAQAAHAGIAGLDRDSGDRRGQAEGVIARVEAALTARGCDVDITRGSRTFAA